jgi:hypothetical protein
VPGETFQAAAADRIFTIEQGRGRSKPGTLLDREDPVSGRGLKGFSGHFRSTR